MNRATTKLIVVHHTVTPQKWGQIQTIQNIKATHSGMSPYHRVIGKDWVWQDPNQLEVKFHAGNYPVNLESIAVSLVGNFTIDTLLPYQKEQLKKALQDWMKLYKIGRTGIKLHREVRLQPTACPGSIDQVFISKLLTPSMTCEQQLAQEIASHKETLERERDNYKNWQTTLDEKNRLRDELAEEKRQHAETVKRAEDNYNNWQAALDALGPLKQKIENAKNALA